MSSRYGSRARGGTKSILAARKRSAAHDKGGTPKPRKNVSMLSDAALIGLMKTGRPRDRSKLLNEISKRGLSLPVAA